MMHWSDLNRQYYAFFICDHKLPAKKPYFIKKKKMFSDKLDQSFQLHPNSPLAEAQYWHADVRVGLGEEKKWEQTFPLPLI